MLKAYNRSGIYINVANNYNFKPSVFHENALIKLDLRMACCKTYIHDIYIYRTVKHCTSWQTITWDSCINFVSCRLMVCFCFVCMLRGIALKQVFLVLEYRPNASGTDCMSIQWPETTRYKKKWKTANCVHFTIRKPRVREHMTPRKIALWDFPQIYKIIQCT